MFQGLLSARSQAFYNGLRIDPGRALARGGVGAWSSCGNGQSHEPLFETCSTLLSPLNSPLNSLLPFSPFPWWPHRTTPGDLLPEDDISNLSRNLGVVLNLPSRYHVLSVATSWLSLISTRFSPSPPPSRWLSHWHVTQTLPLRPSNYSMSTLVHSRPFCSSEPGWVFSPCIADRIVVCKHKLKHLNCFLLG